MALFADNSLSILSTMQHPAPRYDSHDMGGYPYTMNCLVQESSLVDAYNRMVGKQMSFFQETPAPSPQKKARHRRTFKELSREICCPVESCKRKYASRSSLSTHMRLKHSKEAQRQQEEEEAKKKKEQCRAPKPLKPKSSISPVPFSFAPSGVMLPPTSVASTPASYQHRPSISSRGSISSASQLGGEAFGFDDLILSALEDGSSDLESLFDSDHSPTASPGPAPFSPQPAYMATPPAFHSCDDMSALLSNPAMSGRPHQIIIHTGPAPMGHVQHYTVSDMKYLPVVYHQTVGPHYTTHPMHVMPIAMQ